MCEKHVFAQNTDRGRIGVLTKVVHYLQLKAIIILIQSGLIRVERTNIDLQTSLSTIILTVTLQYITENTIKAT